MTVFWRLLIGHFLTDFVFHQRKMHELKIQKPLLGFLAHGAIYYICGAILCFPFLGMEWLAVKGLSLNGWAAMGVLCAFHLLADKLNRADTMQGGHYNTVYFLLWQAINIFVLFLVFPVLPVEEFLKTRFLTDRFFIVVCGALFVTYFLTIFLHLIKRDLELEDYPVFDERYTAMLYRLVLYFVILFPSYWGYLFGTLWLGVVVYAKGKRIFDACHIKMLGGTILTILTAFAVRFVLYHL